MHFLETGLEGKIVVYSHTILNAVISLQYTAKEGPVRIQYKCLVAIYVFPEMKLRGLVISKTGSVCLFCCSQIGRPILGIYKSLIDTLMWELGMRPRSHYSGNT
jgi:hypothetical protein